MLWWTLRQFKSQNQSKRIKAAQKLGASSDMRAVGPLITTALNDENSNVREAAAEALEKIGGPAVNELLQATKPVFNELLRAIIAPSEDVKNRIVELLCQIGNHEQGMDFLIKALNDKGVYAVVTGIHALGRIGNEKAIDALISLIENRINKRANEKGLFAIFKFHFVAEWEVAIELAKLHHPRANYYLNWAIGDAKNRSQFYYTDYQDLIDHFGAKSFVDNIYRGIEDYLQRATKILKADSQTKHAESSFLGGQVKTIDEVAEEQGRKLGIQIVDDNALALSRKADEFRRTGNYEKAIELYNEAIQIESNFYEAHNNLGLTYFEIGNIDNAIAEYSQALLVKPNYIGGEPAHINFTNALKRKGLSTQSINLYKQVVERLPENLIQHCILGHLYEEAKMYDAAAKEYEATLSLTESGEWADMAREGLQLIHSHTSSAENKLS